MTPLKQIFDKHTSMHRAEFHWQLDGEVYGVLLFGFHNTPFFEVTHVTNKSYNVWSV